VDGSTTTGTVDCVTSNQHFGDEALTAEQHEALHAVRADIARDLADTSGWTSHVTRRQVGMLVALGALVLLLATVPAFFLHSRGLREQASARSDLQAFVAFQRGQGPHTSQVLYVENHAVVTQTSTGTTYALSAGGVCLGVTVESGVVGEVSQLAKSDCVKH
jgi:hypothetical protein